MDVFMQTVIIVIHLMLVTGLIGVVLLQRSEGGGLGMGSGGGGFMSSRGTGNLLTRATGILAGLFFVTSLVLSIIASMGRQPTSILTPLGGTPAAVPGAPSPSGQPGTGGVLNQLRGAEQPAAPAAPAGPAVPQSQ
jgi:preprotein translocase subunit SecG